MEDISLPPPPPPPHPRFRFRTPQEFQHLKQATVQYRLWTKKLIKSSNPKCRLYWWFCLGWCSNFVGSESGQIVVNSWRIWSTKQLNTPHPPTATRCLYILYIQYVHFGEGGGVGGGHREGRGAIVHKSGRKYQHNWLYLDSINSIKHQ